jgi:hypothetical protein
MVARIAAIALVVLIAPSALALDCNGDGVDDVEELRSGRSADCNGNQVPDGCEGEPWVFGDSRSIAVQEVTALAVGDLDGDGAPDLVIASQRPRTLYAAMNAGGGREFRIETVPIPDPAHNDVKALQAVDFDRDGDLDVVSASTGGVLVYLNDGGGTFGAGPSAAAGERPTDLVVLDLDGDGRLDAAVVDRNLDTVNIVRQDAGGAFGEPIAIAVGDAPLSIAALDADGDGDADLVSANSLTDDLSVLINRGDGSFEAGPAVAAGDRPLWIESIETGSGPMLIAAGQRWLQLFRPGLLGLEGARRVALPSFAISPKGIVAGDANRDGDLDVIAGYSAGMLAFVDRAVGSPPGGFVRVDPGVSQSLRALDAADFDGDGWLDLVFAAQTETYLFWGGDDALALRWSSTRVPYAAEPHWAAIVDLNGDAFPDVVSADGSFSSATPFINNGSGGLVAQRTLRSAGYLNSIAAADFDADGREDFAVADLRSNLVTVFFNLGELSFRNLQLRVDTGPFYMCSGDFNGDGRPDLLTANQGTATLSTVLSNGDGGFARSISTRVGFAPRSLAVADFDGDGDTDAAVAAEGGNLVKLAMNDGGGSFPELRSIPLRGANYLIAADFDGDGDPDLAVSSLARWVALYENRQGSLQLAGEVRLNFSPFSLAAADFNDDRVPDLAVVDSVRGLVAVLQGKGGFQFSAPSMQRVGSGPRAILTADIDQSGATDIVTGDHDTLNLTVLLGAGGGGERKPYLESLCTAADLVAISVSASGGSRERLTKFVAPAGGPAPGSIPVVFQNVRVEPVHQEFLARNFPEQFPGFDLDLYDALVNRRATRQYFIGNFYRLRLSGRPVYGFSLLGGFFDDPRELPTPDEVRRVRDALAPAFRLGELVYYPDDRLTRRDAARWRDSPVPMVLEETEPASRYEAYTTGVAFGRVRILDEAGFAAANERGAFGFQDLLILERAPRDIEGVVGGVVTAEPQGELSHLAVRTARRGTPNAFIFDALRGFAAEDGELVRLEIRALDFELRPASVEEAEAWWKERRPRLSVLPQVDEDFTALASLDEMDVSGAVAPPESRFGGKAANLARLQRLLTGPFERYREAGFVVPMGHYLDFLRSNRIASALDPEREVSYEEFLREMLADPALQSDAARRFAALEAFREHVVDDGVVDPALVRRIAVRIASIFGATSLPVRCRSSSNVEDALEFNGAGLYESLSACAADDLDSGGDNGPSQCNPLWAAERGVERALKRVWASLWNFRAHEERAFYGLPQERVAMGVLLTRAFTDERANGVAFTGNPTNPSDRRYVVSAQIGETSVVAPEPGVLPEKSLLEVVDGEVLDVVRAVPSSLAPRDARVISDAELRELAAVLWKIEQEFPVDLGPHRREDVLFDIEFKIKAGGGVAVKQVRPFLLSSPAPPAPVFEVEVPPGLEACGSFVEFRSPQDTWTLKSVLRLRPGLHRLRTDRSSYRGVDLFEELLLGPAREPARPAGPGLVSVQKALDGGETRCTFRYQQDFVFEDGRNLRLELDDLVLRARGAEPLSQRTSFAEQFAAGSITIDGDLGLVLPYEPCRRPDLPLWEVTALTRTGTQLRFLERHRPPAIGETGPASLVRAEIDLSAEFGGRRVVEGYWNLVYTAVRHNRNVRYWVVLDPPLAAPSLPAPVRVVDLTLADSFFALPAKLQYLDENFQPIESPALRSVRRNEVQGVFRRGDVDDDGAVNISDAIVLLDHLFRAGEAPACDKAADANDDGALNLSDPVRLLDHLFRGLGPLPAPAAACGADSTDDGLGCDQASSC